MPRPNSRLSSNESVSFDKWKILISVYSALEAGTFLFLEKYENPKKDFGMIQRVFWRSKNFICRKICFWIFFRNSVVRSNCRCVVLEFDVVHLISEYFMSFLRKWQGLPHLASMAIWNVIVLFDKQQKNAFNPLEIFPKCVYLQCFHPSAE